MSCSFTFAVADKKPEDVKKLNSVTSSRELFGELPPVQKHQGYEVVAGTITNDD